MNLADERVKDENFTARPSRRWGRGPSAPPLSSPRGPFRDLPSRRRAA